MPQKFNEEYLQLFTELAKNNNCEIQSLCNNYIFEIKDLKSKNKFFIINNCLPLNDGSAKFICFDKVALSDILTNNKIDNIEHILYKNLTDKHYKNNIDLYDYFLKHNKKVVLKNNHGSSGIDVYLAQTKAEFKKYLKIIYKKNEDIAICPFVDFKEEYRCIMLDGKCEICFRKVRPFVVGNGRDAIKELVLKKYSKDILREVKQKTSTILKQGEKLLVGWKHNLSCGSVPEVILDKNLKKRLCAIAKRCTSLLGLRFCSVDIIDDGQKLRVLEINSIVNANKFASYSKENEHMVKEMYNKAFIKMLKLKRG